MIIFMYFASFGFIGVQYIFADILGITLTSPDGVEIRSSLSDIVDMDAINEVTTNIANATSSENSTLSAIDNAFQLGYNVGKDLLMLLTGTYIFNVLYLFGIPTIFIVPMVIVYVFLLGRQLIALIRGV